MFYLILQYFKNTDVKLRIFLNNFQTMNDMNKHPCLRIEWYLKKALLHVH